MNTLQTIALILHVLAGVGGVIAAYALWMGLLHFKPNFKKVLRYAGWSFIFYAITWVTGGYYYLTYYGSKVKPVILASAYPWAHTLMTELKEHLFLFLPFLAVVIYLVVRGQQQQLLEQPKIRRALLWLVGVDVVLGIVVTLAGASISAAAH